MSVSLHLTLSGNDDDIALSNDVANDAKSNKTMGKLINIIPDSRLLIASLPGSALRTLVESLDKPCGVNKRSQSLA